MKQLFILFFFLPHLAFAASLSPNTVDKRLGDPQGVFTATPGNSCYFFDSSNVYQGEQLNCNGKYFMGGDLFSVAGGDFDDVPWTTFGPAPLNVTVIEAEGGNANPCASNISDCRSLPSFVNEFVISVIQTALSQPPPSGGGGGPVQYRPEIFLLKPKARIFSSAVEVGYQATDKNDLIAGEKERFGLGNFPVSLFYSDFISVWDQQLILKDLKILIIKDLSASGSHTWETKDIPEGDGYRIIADVTDNFGDIGENVSELFSIDHSAPIFRVVADPVVSRGEDVKISIESSEDLVEAPIVKVEQDGLPTVTIDTRGEKRHFEAVYKVVTGYDGPATIFVFGKDAAGNSGDLIVSGGNFFVGMEPPPKPIIISPLDKEAVNSEFVSAVILVIILAKHLL